MSSAANQRAEADRQWGYSEWPIPQVGTSPITGIEGTGNWGSLNRPDVFSRWVIGDSDLDECSNFMPQTVQQKLVPNLATSALCTLASAPLWDFTTILNGNVYHYCLCANGTIYQVSVPGGAITTVGTGFSVSPACDITVWQGAHILISDPVAQKIYDWNGSTLTTVFSGQPNTYIAVYGGRLWIASALACTFTQGGTYNSFAGDSGAFQVTDSSAANPIIALVSFQGALYFFGSNWIATLTNIQSTGTPAVVSFTFQILQAQVGIVSKWSVITVGTNLYFANVYGFWQLSGAVPTKISDVLDGFFTNFNQAASSYSASFTQVLGEPLVMWHLNWTDPSGGPLTGQTVFCYTASGQWFRLNQGAITFIASTVSSAITNNFPKAWAIIGNSIYEMFAAPLSPLTGTLNFKVWDFGSRMKFKTIDYLAIFAVAYGPTSLNVQLINYDGSLVGPVMTKTVNPLIGLWVNLNNFQGQWINASSVSGSWQGIGVATYQDFQFNCGFEARGMGFNLAVNGFSAAIQSIVIGYRSARLTARGTPQSS